MGEKGYIFVEMSVVLSKVLILTEVCVVWFKCCEFSLFTSRATAHKRRQLVRYFLQWYLTVRCGIKFIGKGYDTDFVNMSLGLVFPGKELSLEVRFKWWCL